MWRNAAGKKLFFILACVQEKQKESDIKNNKRKVE